MTKVEHSSVTWKPELGRTWRLPTLRGHASAILISGVMIGSHGMTAHQRAHDSACSQAFFGEGVLYVILMPAHRFAQGGKMQDKAARWGSGTGDCDTHIGPGDGSKTARKVGRHEPAERNHSHLLTDIVGVPWGTTRRAKRSRT